MKNKIILNLLILLLGVNVNFLYADSITFNASSGNLGAAAAFNVTGGNLQVTLTNTSMADVLAPSEVLTAVFFTIAGNPTLTPLSAILSSGSSVLFDDQPTGGNIGGEWAYKNGITGPGGANSGISSSGLGIFGDANFNGSDLQAPGAVDGLQYGITSAGDLSSIGNSAVTGRFSLIQNSVTFSLTGLPAGFSLTDISNVNFQYGTCLNEPNINPVPEPATLVLLGAGLLSLAGAARRKKK